MTNVFKMRNRCLLVTNLTDSDATESPLSDVRRRFPFCEETRPESTRVEYLEKLAKKYANYELVVGAGGGVAIDVAKYIGASNGVEVIGFPTIISTDAMYTSSTAVREHGMVRYIPTKKPDEIILDFDLIIQAPYRLNVAGWGDILSIHTAVWDWQLAAQRIGETYSTEVAGKALRLLDKAVRVDAKEGLMRLNECLQAEVALCEEFGSARPEEGSEHLFAYLIENYLPTNCPHGELVAVGICELSKIQQNRVDFITGLMDRIGLKYRSEDLGIDERIVKRVLKELPNYSKRHKFFYTVIDEVDQQIGPT